MATALLRTRRRFACPCCQHKKIHRKYFADHLLRAHFHNNPIECIYPNCGSTWPSETLFNLHCDLKHNGMKKSLVTSDKAMNEEAEKVRLVSQFPESGFASMKLRNMLSKSSLRNNLLHKTAEKTTPMATRSVKAEIVDDNSDMDANMDELLEDVNSSKSPVEANFFDRWKKYGLGGEMPQQQPKSLINGRRSQDGSAASKSSPSSNRKRPSRSSGGAKAKRRKQSSTTERKGLKECQLCHSEVTAVKNHMLFHLKKTLGVAWLFKCLLCETFETVYWCNFHVHVTSVHGMRANTLQCGVDYINRRADYKKQLADLQMIAFPQIESQYRGGPSSAVIGESSSRKTPQQPASSRTTVVKREPVVVQEPAKPVVVTQRRKFVSTSALPSRNRSKHCYLCNSDVNAMTIRDHSLSHLKEQTGIPGLYKCLMCSNLQTVYYRCLQKHIAVVHGEQIESLENNVHYLDQKAKFEQQIQEVHHLAFPADGVTSVRPVKAPIGTTNNYRSKINRYKKVLQQATSQRNRGGLLRPKTAVMNKQQLARKTKNYRPQCQLCGVETNYTMTTGHVISHLKETGEIPWFYKCLLCDDLSTFYFRSLQIHMLYIHDKRRDALVENVDYANQKSRFTEDIRKIHALAFPPSKSDPQVQEDEEESTVAEASSEDQQPLSAFKFRQVGSMHSKGQQPLPVFVARGGRNAPPKNPQLSCQLCPAKLSTSTVYSHALVHLKDKTGIPWLYKCLLCKEFDSVYLSSLNSHMFTVHREQRSLLQEGVHFLDQKGKYEEEIRQVRLLAFPSTEPSTNLSAASKLINTSQQQRSTSVKQHNSNSFLSVREISPAQRSSTASCSSTALVSVKPKAIPNMVSPNVVAASPTLSNNNNINSRHFCQICGTEVHSTTMNSHSMSHLKEQTGIPWLYKCLLCDKVRTVHSRCLSVHMLKVHKKNRFTLQPGVHYIDQRFKYEQEIEHVRRLAFPNSVVEQPSQQQQQQHNDGDADFNETYDDAASNSSFVNDETSGSSTEAEHQQQVDELNNTSSLQYSCQSLPLISKNRVQCQLCNGEVHPASTGGHSLSHFKEQTGIQWLYKCLLCTDFHTIYHRSVQAHLIKLHNRRRMHLQEGVHYMSQLQKYKKEVEQVRLLAFPTNQYIGSNFVAAESPLKLKIKLSKVKDEEEAEVDEQDQQIDFEEPMMFDDNNDEYSKLVAATKPKRGTGNRFSLTQVLPQQQLQQQQQQQSSNTASATGCRLQCSLCSADVSSTSVESHVFSHLKEEASIPWLFKCLLCQSFNSIYYRSLRKHMLEVHGLDYTKMKPGTNFVDQTSKYLNIIKQVQLSAFPSFSKSVIPPHIVASTLSVENCVETESTG